MQPFKAGSAHTQLLDLSRNMDPRVQFTRLNMATGLSPNLHNARSYKGTQYFKQPASVLEALWADSSTEFATDEDAGYCSPNTFNTSDTVAYVVWDDVHNNGVTVHTRDTRNNKNFVMASWSCAVEWLRELPNRVHVIAAIDDDKQTFSALLSHYGIAECKECGENTLDIAKGVYNDLVVNLAYDGRVCYECKRDLCPECADGCMNEIREEWFCTKCTAELEDNVGELEPVGGGKRARPASCGRWEGTMWVGGKKRSKVDKKAERVEMVRTAPYIVNLINKRTGMALGAADSLMQVSRDVPAARMAAEVVAHLKKHGVYYVYSGVIPPPVGGGTFGIPQLNLFTKNKAGQLLLAADFFNGPYSGTISEWIILKGHTSHVLDLWYEVYSSVDSKMKVMVAERDTAVANVATLTAERDDARRAYEAVLLM